MNDVVVQNRMEPRDGRLVLGSGASYQLLYVVPTDHPSMPLATLTKIRDLLARGATVVWAGPLPKQCPGLSGGPECDAQFKRVAEELWADKRLVKLPQERPLAAGAAGRPEAPSRPAGRQLTMPPLRFVHRRTADAEIFFVVNRATWAVDTPGYLPREGAPGRVLAARERSNPPGLPARRSPRARG